MQTIQVSKATDMEVVEKVIAGQISLFELLIRRHNPALYKVGRSFGFRHHDVEDLMQESNVAAYLHLRQFAGRSSYKTWLTSIMINQCRARAQKVSHKNEITGDQVLQENTVVMFTHDYKHDTDRSVINKELGHILEQVISQLPNDYSTVFTLRELTGLSVSETAEVLGISEANVKVRLNRARTMLKKQLAAFYSTEDIFEFNLIYCDKIVDQVMSRIQALSN